MCNLENGRIEQQSWCYWLMFVILVTLQAEIIRIQVLRHPRQIVQETLSQIHAADTHTRKGEQKKENTQY
jgi:hypothetical protein